MSGLSSIDVLLTVLTVTESLLRSSEVSFSGAIMRIVKPSSNDPPTSTHPEPVSVHVAGFPPGTTEDLVVMYLENKRKSGGGRMRSIQYDDVSGTAVVCFEDDAGTTHYSQHVLFILIMVIFMINFTTLEYDNSRRPLDCLQLKYVFLHFMTL